MPQGAPSQMNMRSVMSILRRTTSATRLRAGPNRTSASQEALSGGVSELGSPIGSSTSMYNIDEEEIADTPPVDVRAQFKKQMLEKELDSCIRQKRLLFKLDELKQTESRLSGEQRELLAERERCIAHDTSHNLPRQEQYYMDERLDCIDYETALIKSRVVELDNQLSLINKADDGVVGSKEDMTMEQDAFENAENILKSLDGEEMQVVSGLLMKETVDLRVSSIDKDMKLAEKEKMLLELRAVLETTRAAALKTSMQFEAKIVEIQDDARRIVDRATASPERVLAFGNPLPELRVSPDPRHSPEAGSQRNSPTPQLLESPTRPLVGVKSKSMFVTMNRGSLSPTPLPDIAFVDPTRGIWEQHGNDPAIVAQAVVNDALASTPPRRNDTSPRKTMEELNATLTLRKEVGGEEPRRKNSRRRPPRPASAPIPPIATSGKADVTVGGQYLRRSPSPVLLRPMASVVGAKGKKASGDGDDSRIWQEALNSLHAVEQEPAERASGGRNVFDRLSRKHTISSFLKK